MASDAEVDLVVNATGALQRVQRELDRLVRIAENDTDPVVVRAAINRREFLTRQLPQLQRDLRSAEDRLRMRVDVDVDEDTLRRFNISLGDVGRRIGGVLGPVAKLSGGIAAVGAAAGTAAPLLGGLVAATEQLLPASAVATTGLLSVVLATNAVKIGMIGVEDAIEAAFDPEAKPEDLAKAMENLAPEARKFVLELQGMQKSFDSLRLEVQDRLFANLSGGLRRLGTSVMPQVQAALVRTADSLNDMAVGAVNAAVELGENGVLQQALAGATHGLRNLEEVPGRAVTAFGQLAAAASPAFGRITSAIDRMTESAAKGLTEAFESGELEKSIDKAVASFAQLGRAVGNIFEGLGNIFGAVSQDGQGLFTVLETITQAFADITATRTFQGAMGALSDTMALIARTVGPLLAQAFEIIGQVIIAIAPSVQELVRVLGGALGRVLEALAPVLVSLAGTFADLIIAVTPLIPLAAELIAAILPALTPLFEALGRIIQAATPFIEELAGTLTTALVPIFEKFAEVMVALAPHLSTFAEQLFPLLTDAIIELQPGLMELVDAFLEIVDELIPLIPLFAEMARLLIEELLPVLTPLLVGLAILVSEGLKVLADALRIVADFIRDFVVPALETIVKLLEGDFKGAFESAQRLVENVTKTIAQTWTDTKDRIVRVVTDLSIRVTTGFRNFLDQISQAVSFKLQEVREFFAALPAKIVASLGSAGTLLFGSGVSIVQGLINGITSQIGRVQEKIAQLAGVVSAGIKGALGISSPSKLMISFGEDISEGLAIGISRGVADVRREVGALSAIIPSTLEARVGGVGNGTLETRSPEVNVFLGNQLLTGFVDARVDTLSRRDTRTLAQGVRR